MNHYDNEILWKLRQQPRRSNSMVIAAALTQITAIVDANRAAVLQ